MGRKKEAPWITEAKRLKAEREAAQANSNPTGGAPRIKTNAANNYNQTDVVAAQQGPLRRPQQGPPAPTQQDTVYNPTGYNNDDPYNTGDVSQPLQGPRPSQQNTPIATSQVAAVGRDVLRGNNPLPRPQNAYNQEALETALMTPRPATAFDQQFQGQPAGRPVDIPVQDYIRQMKDFEQTRPKMAWEDRNRPRPAAASTDIPFASEGNQVLEPNYLVSPTGHKDYQSSEPYNEQLQYPGARTAVRAAAGSALVRDASGNVIPSSEMRQTPRGLRPGNDDVGYPSPVSPMQAANRDTNQTMPAQNVGVFDMSGKSGTVEEQFSRMQPQLRQTLLRNPKLAPLVRSSATMEERYKAQGIAPPGTPEARGGSAFENFNDAVMNASRGGLDLGGFAKDIWNDPKPTLDSIRSTINKFNQWDVEHTGKAPALLRAANRYGAELIDKRVPALDELNAKAENYANTGKWEANAPATPPADTAPSDVVKNSGNNTAPGSRPIYKQADGSYSDVQTPGSTPYTPSNPIRSWGIGGTQGSGAPTSGNTGVNNPTNYNNADGYNTGGGLSGLRGRGSVRTAASPPAGSNVLSSGINGASTLRTFGANDGQQYAAQVAAAQQANARSRERVMSNRLAGASEGGDILRQVDRINRRAQSAYDSAIGSGLNSKAAARAAGAVQDQANTLVNAQANLVRDKGNQLRARSQDYSSDVYRERTNVDADLGYRQLQANLGEKQAQKLDGYIDDAALGLVPPGTDKDDQEGVAARMKLRIRSAIPPNWGRLGTQAQGEALQRATADASFLEELSKIAGYNYLSKNELLSPLDDSSLTDGKLSQEDLSFWRAVFDDGLLDAAVEWVRGDQQITLPGTNKQVTVTQIKSLYNMSRRRRAQYFAPPL